METTEMELTEEEARQVARQLARQLGDEEWERGETRYALAAWEASDISAAELFQKAQKLLCAVELEDEWIKAEAAANQLPKEGHKGGSHRCTEESCLQCQTLNRVYQQYRKQRKGMLGFEPELSSIYCHRIAGQRRPLYRAGAVACLTTLKRMYPG